MGVATDCLGVMCKLEKQSKAIIIATKSRHMVRELFFLKSKRLKLIKFKKVDAHQDDVKPFDELSFLEQSNVQCDARAKALTLSALEDVAIPFPLVLSSTCVMATINQWMLNHPKDTLLQVCSIKCEEHLKKVLKTCNFSSTD